MTNLVIVNNEARLLELPAVAPTVDDGGNVTDAGFPAQKLGPGENDVDATYWGLVKGNKAVDMWLKCRILSSKGKGKAVPLLKQGLDRLNPQAISHHIAACSDISTLNEWKELSDRPDVKQQIDARIGEIMRAPAEGEGDEG